MIRSFLVIITGLVAIVVLAVILMFGSTIVSPFFDLLGGTEHSSIGGVSGDDAINYRGAAFMFGLALLSVPAAIGLHHFFAGNGRRSRNRF